MKILGALVCGVLIGLVGTGGAHHSRDERKLTQRVDRLEQKLSNVQSDVVILDSKTGQLEPGGQYSGRIQNDQVFSPNTVCGHADDSVWVEDENDGEDISYLGCVRGPYGGP